MKKRLFFISTIIILVITSSVSFASLRMLQVESQLELNKKNESVSFNGTEKKIITRKKYKLSADISSRSQEDTIPKERYRLSKKEFISRYATDDTSKALIKYYFNKRSSADGLIMLFSFAAIGEIYLIVHSAYVSATSDSDGVILLTFLGTIIYTVLFFIPGLASGIGGIEKSYRYSRKKLYIDLMNYQSGKGIDPSIMIGMLKNKLCWQ